MVTPIAIGLVVLAGAGFRASTAPGPSSKAHESIADNCDACHLPFKGLPNEKCLGCHKELRQFHANVADQKCTACHGEHKGADADQTKPAARKSFDHGLTGMPLLGAHAKVPCAKCHDKPIDQLGGTCAACHKDVHKGALGNKCIACHESKAWKPALKGLDDHTISMADGHAKLKECTDCHSKGAHLQQKVGCAECHEQAHGGTTAPCEGCHQVKGWKPAEFDHGFCTCQLPQKHQTVGCLGCHQDWNFTKTPTTCSGCHEKERKHEPLGECGLCHSAVSWKQNRFDHNKRSKFKLVGLHTRVACEQCHAPPAGGKEMKFRGVPQTCEGCHQKQGDTAHGDFGPCAKCHANEGWKPSPFDHGTTGFPLVGKHAALKCQTCHAEKVKGYPHRPILKKASVNDWLAGAVASRSGFFVAQGTPERASHTQDALCSACHADPHRGSTKKLGECSTCHGNEAFKPATFDHGQTPFPLLGKHAAVKCAMCHQDSKFDEAPKDCAGCHVDRHAGKLANRCEKCHQSFTAFKPATGFDHAITGFALTGRHAGITCASCHEGKKGAAMKASAAPSSCGTCHTAQHGKELGADCTACHDPGKGKFHDARGMAFDHAKTGFPLERKHATAPCGACHKAAGPPPTPACRGCHPDPHSGQLGLGCEECHVPDRFRLVRFDHDRTGWPLRGRHFMAPCASCHVAQRWVGLTGECFDCHAADAARGKARLPAKHPFGPLDCAQCHTSQWRW